MTESRGIPPELCGDDEGMVASGAWALDTVADADTFRAAMGRMVSAVTVVTTRHEGRPWGMTVNAFTSVCLEPPTVLVCINSGTITAEDIHREGRFAANLLSQKQVLVSRLCSRPGAAKYVDDYVITQDLPASVAAPALQDSLVTFDCALRETRLVGSHFVVLGAVRTLLAPEPKPALLFGQGRYQRGVHIEDASAKEAVA